LQAHLFVEEVAYDEFMYNHQGVGDAASTQRGNPVFHMRTLAPIVGPNKIYLGLKFRTWREPEAKSNQKSHKTMTTEEGDQGKPPTGERASEKRQSSPRKQEERCSDSPTPPHRDTMTLKNQGDIPKYHQGYTKVTVTIVGIAICPYPQS
jgi:hypothetical protein